jgi:hypothetical protein
MDSRKSHWPIYDVVPIELIETVSKTVREAPVKTVASKDGMKEGKVVYFIGRESGESSESVRERN